MVGWRSQHLPVYLHPKLPPILPVQSVNELGHEPRRMVQRQQFVKRRRQHPHLLSAHLSKRHLNISPIYVASKIHPTTYPWPVQTSETANFSLGGLDMKESISRPRISSHQASGPSGLEARFSIIGCAAPPLRLAHIMAAAPLRRQGRSWRCHRALPQHENPA